MSRIIVVETCGKCPYYYTKYSYGEDKVHRCRKLLNITKDYKPFSECLDIKHLHHTIDERCPLQKQ